MVALGLTYADYIRINEGEKCGICGRPRSKRRKLDRDHDHAKGVARGLLCSRCNRALPSWITVEWLKAAIAYLKRAEQRGEALHATEAEAQHPSRSQAR